MFGILPCLAILSTDPVQLSWRLQDYTNLLSFRNAAAVPKEFSHTKLVTRTEVCSLLTTARPLWRLGKFQS